MIETGEVSLSTSNLVPNVMLIGSSNEGTSTPSASTRSSRRFAGASSSCARATSSTGSRSSRSTTARWCPACAPTSRPTPRRWPRSSRCSRACVAPRPTGCPSPSAPSRKSSTRWRRPTSSRSAPCPRATATRPPRSCAPASRRLSPGEGRRELRGQHGASPREIRGAAARRRAGAPGTSVLSPFAVLEKIADLCRAPGRVRVAAPGDRRGRVPRPAVSQKALRTG
jgi:hypothetical protein